jgi:hypothetical protein
MREKYNGVALYFCNSSNYPSFSQGFQSAQNFVDEALLKCRKEILESERALSMD